MCKKLLSTIAKSVFILGVLSISLQAQDTLVDGHGKVTVVKIIRILPTTIEYKKLSNPDGPLYVSNKCDNREIRFENATTESFVDECASPQVAKALPAKQLMASIEGPYGAFGLFNVDWVFTKSLYTFGVTPSALYRFYKNIATGLECMLLWGQVDTTDPLRFIINPNIRNEVLFPIKEKITLALITSAGLSFWPQLDTVGTLDSTYFNNRNGWNARAAFGVDWCITPSLSLLLNAGYSASSSVSENVWITHDMMMIVAGIRYSFDIHKRDRP